MSRKKIKKRKSLKLAGVSDLLEFVALAPDMLGLASLQREIITSHGITDKSQIEVLLFFAELQRWRGFDGVSVQDSALISFVESWRDRNLQAMKKIRKERNLYKEFTKGIGQ